MDIFKISVDGSEVARVSGDGIEYGKRLVDRFSEKFEDDPRMLKLISNGRTVFVLYVHPSDSVTVEKVESNA